MPRNLSVTVFAVARIFDGEIAGDLTHRRAIGLRKDHGKSSGAGAERCDAVGDLGQPCARPRPLPVGRNRFLVDIDDAHRKILIGARLQALIGVERALLQFSDEPRTFGAQPGQRRKDDEGGAGCPAGGGAAAACFCSSGTFACATIFFVAGLNVGLPLVWSA